MDANMATGIVSDPFLLESLQDRLSEAEQDLTVPLRDAQQQWRRRALERERSAPVAGMEQSFSLSVGKVVAIAAAVAAGAAVYKILSSEAAGPEVISRIRENLPQTD